MKAPTTLLEAVQYFSDEQVCIDTVAMMRWPQGVRCGYCDADKPYYLKSQKRFKCRACRKQFSVKVNSIFEDSPIKLTKWLPALWLIVNCKNGISSYEISRDLGVTQKTAWFMLQRLRLALRARDFSFKLGSPEGGGVEADATFIGGNPQKMHKARRMRINAAFSMTPRNERAPYVNKTVVHGLYDRTTRQVRAKVVPNVKRETLQSEILDSVHQGSRMYTDDASSYGTLKDHFVHETVSHIDDYVRGEVHTNCLENFWSLTKRTLRGTYVAVEPFHMDRYLDEQIFRFNNRATKDNPLNDADRFYIALAGVANKRLTYAEVTGKVSTTQA